MNENDLLAIPNYSLDLSQQFNLIFFYLTTKKEKTLGELFIMLFYVLYLCSV